MKKVEVGDLVHIPSEVVLCKKTNSYKSPPSEWKKTERPISLLITAISNENYEVFYEDHYWLVEKKNVYKI